MISVTPLLLVTSPSNGTSETQHDLLWNNFTLQTQITLVGKEITWT